MIVANRMHNAFKVSNGWTKNLKKKIPVLHTIMQC